VFGVKVYLNAGQNTIFYLEIDRLAFESF